MASTAAGLEWNVLRTTAQKKAPHQHVDPKKMDAEFDMIREIYNDPGPALGFVP